MNEGERVTCPCGSPMALEVSRYGKFWGCTRYPMCRETHGAHPDGKPLGIPADKATRQARIRAHAAFDRWWRVVKGWKRGRAYDWLAKHGPKPHIAEMTAAECETLIEMTKQWGTP